MSVVATVGHVDHGKSTLVRRLTAMEPDRWADEHRRGLSIDLGFAWTTLPSGADLAIVDVPGHERFVTNMLAGVGTVTAALVVVAADGGWMPQTEEHVSALDALGVGRGILVISRSDLAPPGPTLQDARRRLAETSLAGIPAVTVSGTNGQGIDELRRELDELVSSLPAPNTDLPARLWVDRSFVIDGAGTVVTGALPAGTIRTEDRLTVSRSSRTVRVRAIQTLGSDVPAAVAGSRVALNLRGVDREEIRRGDVLLAGGPWEPTSEVDALCSSDTATCPANATLHLGSAAIPVRIRRLGSRTVRLYLRSPLPLLVGDRGLLRDPGRHAISCGINVLDPHPPALHGRGSARARAIELETMSARDRTLTELRRRRFMGSHDFASLGLEPVGEPVAGDWYADSTVWEGIAGSLADTVRRWAAERPLDAVMPLDAARRLLGIPDRVLAEAAAARAGLRVRDGGLALRRRDVLPHPVDEALAVLRRRWQQAPFVAPRIDELADLGLGPREIAAAVRAGRLLRIADGVVLEGGSDDRAVQVLARMPKAIFTLSEARIALGTTRRVAVPLLELLDRQGHTRRISSELRTLVHHG